MGRNSKFMCYFCKLYKPAVITSRQKNRKMEDSSKKKIIKWFWIIVAAPFALLFFMILLVAAFSKIPSFEELEHPDNKLATQLLAENGEVLTTFHIENRTYATYEQLPEHLVQAAVATEDARFYRHSGIDMKSIGRVVVKTLLSRDSSQGGGSTITQQLAKTLYPRREVKSRIPGWSKAVMVWIKLKEWITAVKIERDYTKDEIITMYLNSIFFGSSAYGINAASRTFFAKDPQSLTVEESAMLVGMVNKPTRYNPVLNPEQALQRRNLVISRMEEAGYISQAECDSIRQIPINVSRYEVQDHNAGLAPYFRDMLRRDMQATKPRRSSYEYAEEYRADSLRWRNDPIYGWLNKNTKSDGSKYNLDRDGLKIYTTINYQMQQYAEEAVAEHLGGRLQKDFDRELKGKRNAPFASGVDQKTIDRVMKQARRWSDRWRIGQKNGLSDEEITAQFSVPVRMQVFKWAKDKTTGRWYGQSVDTTMTPDDSIRYYKSVLRTGFVAIEPNTGYVKAYVGGPNYRYFKYDNVRQGRRQVGSTIKPFLYTLAISRGLRPCDKAVCMPQVIDLPNGTTWTPRSTDKSDWIGTTQTLRWGLAHSSNNFSAFLMKTFGPAPLISMMRQMGVTAHLDEVPSLCVGSAEVEIFNMVSSYNIFPSGGVYVTPQYVTRIEDANGNVLTEVPTRKREAIDPTLAYTMANMMQAVVNEGTGSRLRGTYRLGGEIAGKTGTTNDNSDGWFIGYTSNITAGAWVGGEDRQVHFASTAQGGGSNMALPIWGIWYRKCVDHHLPGFTGNVSFVAPANGVTGLSCEDGGTFLGGYNDDMGDGGNLAEHDEEEEYYFN